MSLRQFGTFLVSYQTNVLPAVSRVGMLPLMKLSLVSRLTLVVLR